MSLTAGESELRKGQDRSSRGLSADDSDGATGAKNPFAKKAAAGNPFAKPAASKPLDAIKSKSFFARVDDIESSKREFPLPFGFGCCRSLPDC